MHCKLKLGSKGGAWLSWGPSPGFVGHRIEEQNLGYMSSHSELSSTYMRVSAILPPSQVRTWQCCALRKITGNADLAAENAPSLETREEIWMDGQTTLKPATQLEHLDSTSALATYLLDLFFRDRVDKSKNPFVYHKWPRVMQSLFLVLITQMRWQKFFRIIYNLNSLMVVIIWNVQVMG